MLTEEQQTCFLSGREPSLFGSKPWKKCGPNGIKEGHRNIPLPVTMCYYA